MSDEAATAIFLVVLVVVFLLGVCTGSELGFDDTLHWVETCWPNKPVWTENPGTCWVNGMKVVVE